MEHVLCEPVELTELELDAVAGGRLHIDVDVRDSFNRVDIDSRPDTYITNLVDNSVNVRF